MQQVTFLHSKNGTSVICDDTQTSIFASWYNENEFGNTDNRRKFLYHVKRRNHYDKEV